MRTVDRGVILPVVLMVLLLLGLLGAMFAFRVNADLASTQAVAYRFQTRLAAEAGVERVKLLLRESRYDMDRWYDNIEELHRIIVWADDGNPTVWGSNEESDDQTAVYRFSIVGDDPTDDEDFIRFGITDESAKLNLNTATEMQLLTLVRAAAAGDEEIDPQKIVDAILDWRDKDQLPRGEDGGTEGPYYLALPRPYRVKNSLFDTVEELLLVKGVTAQILYGEDFDRNGLLTPNEDDGDESFPLDNQDGVLNRGLYPYLTVLSLENNVSNENLARVYLLGEEAKVRKELSLVFPDERDVVDFIVSVTRAQGGAGGGSGGDNPRSRGRRSGSSTGRRGSDTSGGDGADPEGTDEPDDGTEAPGTDGTGAAETDDGRRREGPIRTPASLLLDQAISVRARKNPLTLDHLAVLLDRTTTVDPKQQAVAGLINVNTAPRLVLECVEGLAEEQIDSILEVRARLGAEAKETTAWLLTEEVVELETFEQIAPQMTARGQQFTIEALGYADHIGMVTRLEVVVDMVGPIAQTVYYRDLSYLGGHYPIREEDLEEFRGRQSPN